jgi:hypothetical protein
MGKKSRKEKKTVFFINIVSFHADSSVLIRLERQHPDRKQKAPKPLSVFFSDESERGAL